MNKEMRTAAQWIDNNQRSVLSAALGQPPYIEGLTDAQVADAVANLRGITGLTAFAACGNERKAEAATIHVFHKVASKAAH